ncbi:MAG: hypothetical protein CPDRYMAC_4322 [uncultured Paraburkholderia sp.]|nr:MAG: hypothetical protein CPDRYDRY_4169 [uncultured Paraburkholderia sp.]CAH2936078.1 MAG: hypothetical protein CPDRYMAC_4322 [uncultured Paraburkholderia sp.]
MIDSPTLAGKITMTFHTVIPEVAYTVRLDNRGKVFWIAQDSNKERSYTSEPNAAGRSGWAYGSCRFCRSSLTTFRHPFAARVALGLGLRFHPFPTASTAAERAGCTERISQNSGNGKPGT